MSSIETRTKILNEGVVLAEQSGLRGLSRSMLAKKVGIAPTSIMYYYKDLPALRKAILAHAIEVWSPQIIAEAILSGETFEVPQELAEHICESVMACVPQRRSIGAMA